MTRTALITGAASGIGLASRTLLESRGVRVIGADLASAEIEADLSTVDGRAELLAKAGELSGGSLDAVLVAAGVTHGPSAVGVNYFGAVDTLQGLTQLLATSPAPRAAAIASIAASRPAEADAELTRLLLDGDEAKAVAVAADLTYSQVYHSTKVALLRWLRRAAISDAWAGAGITLNAVGPGVIETPMMAKAIADPTDRERLVRENPMPLHWPGRAEEIAEPVAWFLSPENTFVTGQILYADGGFTATMHVREES